MPTLGADHCCSKSRSRTRDPLVGILSVSIDIPAGELTGYKGVGEFYRFTFGENAFRSVFMRFRAYGPL